MFQAHPNGQCYPRTKAYFFPWQWLLLLQHSVLTSLHSENLKGHWGVPASPAQVPFLSSYWCSRSPKEVQAIVSLTLVTDASLGAASCTVSFLPVFFLSVSTFSLGRGGQWTVHCLHSQFWPPPCPAMPVTVLSAWSPGRH